MDQEGQQKDEGLPATAILAKDYWEIARELRSIGLSDLGQLDKLSFALLTGDDSYIFQWKLSDRGIPVVEKGRLVPNHRGNPPADL